LRLSCAMADGCAVCNGTGRLLQDMCPLCEGDASFFVKPASQASQRFVFVLAGQSNMVGRGTGAELDQSTIDFVEAHADVYMAYDIDKSAKEQENTTSGKEFLRLGRETQWSDGGKCYTHGPEWGIAQRVIERFIAQKEGSQRIETSAAKPKMYFIKFAMGSTNLHEDWSPDGSYFEQFISFIKEMLHKVSEVENEGMHEVSPSSVIDCMFWNQGDADASGKAVMRDSYKANLINFVHCVWKSLGSLDDRSPGYFPFIPLQLHYKVDESSKSTKKYRKSMEKVNEAIHEACQELGCCARMAQISAEMEATLTSKCHADGHSGSAALLLEGRHLADTFAEVL